MVDLDIPPEWHINAHRPGDPALIGTQLVLPIESDWKLGSVSYPEGEPLQLGFQNSPTSIYSGQVRFQAQLEAGSIQQPNLTLPVQIRLQACNDQSCLPPEQITLRVALHSTNLSPEGSHQDTNR
ncbi:MAG: protein-disulfide reductase DsbD family protein [Candidatus Thiodiazotropha sp.]